ncbi:MAG TPA: plastocyanin/azurin family copper-binding protein [Gemmatimonadaceae bacterium]|nr:plastocyanin/azurin family copper-binding protein [Gemmatimonadaceae bacterium]
MRTATSLLVAAMLIVPRAATAQSLLERSPNVSGDWTGSPGTLYFHFIHRFSTSGSPERKVTNVPTFLLGAGLPKRFLIGVNYSTNSDLAPRFPNEWELFARWNPLSEDNGSPIDVGGQVGYNNAAEGVDGELSLARRFGIIRVIAAGRALSNPLEEGSVRYAAAGAAVLRLGTYLSLTGDVASLTNRTPAERVAWSAGVHFAIPLTPHTVSLQATNTLVNTLQGSSRGTSIVRYGFEFTIPLTLRRYFGKRAKEADAPERADTIQAAELAQTDSAANPAPAVAKVDTVTNSPAPVPPSTAKAPSAPAPTRTTPPRAAPARTTPAPRPAASAPSNRTVRTGMRNVNYMQTRVEITAGTTVEWTNRDPLAHTVTAVDRSFNSGLIQPGKTFRHTFTKPGTYAFFCMPHPFMKGTIVVK